MKSQPLSISFYEVISNLQISVVCNHMHHVCWRSVLVAPGQLLSLCSVRLLMPGLRLKELAPFGRDSACGQGQSRWWWFSCSVVSDYDPTDCNTPGFPVLYISRNLLKLMSIELVMPSNHLILCHPLLLPPSIFPSIRVFSNELAVHIRRPEYWSFSFSPSNEYSGLISFRIDWFDHLTVQGTLKSLLQHHSSKASILRHSAFFMVQLSLICVTTGKTIALTMWKLLPK